MRDGIRRPCLARRRRSRPPPNGSLTTIAKDSRCNIGGSHAHHWLRFSNPLTPAPCPPSCHSSSDKTDPVEAGPVQRRGFQDAVASWHVRMTNSGRKCNVRPTWMFPKTRCPLKTPPHEGRVTGFSPRVAESGIEIIVDGRKSRQKGPRGWRAALPSSWYGYARGSPSALARSRENVCAATLSAFARKATNIG